MEDRDFTVEADGVARFIVKNFDRSCDAIIFTHTGTCNFEMAVLKRVSELTDDIHIKHVMCCGLYERDRPFSIQAKEYILSSGFKFKFTWPHPKLKTMKLFLTEHRVGMVLSCNFMLNVLNSVMEKSYFDQLIFQPGETYNKKPIRPLFHPKLLLYYGLDEWSDETLNLHYRSPEEWRRILHAFLQICKIYDIDARTWEDLHKSSLKRLTDFYLPFQEIDDKFIAEHESPKE